jgi:hypothetical protein
LGQKRGIAECLEDLAGLDCAQGHGDRAARLLGAAAALRDSWGIPLWLQVEWHLDHECDLAAARDALGEGRFARAWEEGRALSWQAAAAEALTSPGLPVVTMGAPGSSHARRRRKRVGPQDVLPIGTDNKAAPGMDLTDAQWELLQPVLSAPRKRGRPRADDRRTLNGIIYVCRTGCRWQDLPARYGNPITCWRRRAQWQADGTWDRIWNTLFPPADEA